MHLYKSIKEIRDFSRKFPHKIIDNVRAVISSLNSKGKKLHALRYTDIDFSLYQAKQLNFSNSSLPLFGVPLAHKELFGRYIKNSNSWPFEGGSKSFKGRKAKQTAHVISLLDKSGAVDCGRLVTVEFAFGVTGHNNYSGTPKNPWNLEYVCGGSSSGSGSAVAAGIFPAALGTDTGGSVRLPAAACGLVGIKPTQGLVGRSGVFPLSNTLDSVGPLARSVEDAARILQVISGFDAKDKLSIRHNNSEYNIKLQNIISKTKIGLPKNYFLTKSDQIVSDGTTLTFKLIEKLGAECSEIFIPEIENINDLNILMISSEAYKLHEKHILKKHHLLNEQTLMRVLAGMSTTKEDYLKLKKFRYKFILKILSDVFSKIDVFITPVWPCLIPKIVDSDIGAKPEAAELVKRIGHNTRPINFMGLPAVCIPTGFDKNGLPTSIQLVGKPFSEPLLLTIAHALEREYNFWNIKPKN